MRTYDENQMAAVLVTCAGCGRARYSTKPQRLCILCRFEKAKSVDAVDPHAGSTGTRTTREKEKAS